MNTPERNDKNVEKMQKLGRVYEETDEDKKREQRHAIENATREYPLPTARKAAWVICGGFWVFCVAALVFGVDMRGLIPFMFFALAVVVILHLPVFYLKKKIFDLIVGIIFALSCIGTAVSLLIGL